LTLSVADEGYFRNLACEQKLDNYVFITTKPSKMNENYFLLYMRNRR